MEKSVKQRLIEFLKSQNLSQAKFEKSIGVSNGYVNSISKGIGAEKMQRISQLYPELNRTWLLYGEGSMLNSSQVINGNGNCAVNGNNSTATIGNININDENTQLLKERIKHLEEMVAEKERIIQILIKK